MKNPITAIQKYYSETVEQLKKCTWPTGKELRESTVLVISATLFLTLAVFFADQICEFVVRYVTVRM